ncbi:MAG: DUF3769 domain-containing protein [Leptolyngbya sp. LCM1.Bin17]|nr:MAG: DUF3769 domain-containing protein [Leptolyngbya sp. LCM1.Bin17]
MPLLPTPPELPPVVQVTEVYRDGSAHGVAPQPFTVDEQHWQQGDVTGRTYSLLNPTPEGDAVAPSLTQEGTAPPNVSPEAPEALPLDAEEEALPLEVEAVSELLLRADRQVYDPDQQIVIATGNVLVQFGNAQVLAERLWINLIDRYARAEGNVFFSRNDQVIEGDVVTYNLLQGAGTIHNARGELRLSTLAEDFATTFPNDLVSGTVPVDPQRPTPGSISGVTSPGGVGFVTDPDQDLFGAEGGTVRRLRFESERVRFDASGWYADNLRLTNDPFSPPELEWRSNRVSLVPLNADENELVAENPRVVFDQGLSIPLWRGRFILQRGELPPDAFNPLPTGIGIDGRDRGGLFIEREFSLPGTGPLQFTVAPQVYLSRWLDESDFNLTNPANFGVVARLNGLLGPRTSVRGFFGLSGLDLANFDDRLRASFRTQQLIGTHRLSLEYSYRDRLFNGSLGFQDVQNSVGLLFESPNITLGDTQINLRYQLSGQYVTANSDQPDLIGAGGSIGLASLFRFQGAVDLGRSFLLWQGQPLPSTPTEGLRYSPRPLTPSLRLSAGLRGVATYYTSDDLQETLEARVSLSGQVGHLQRNTFDYTAFNIGFSKSIIAGDTSPFLFDRIVDQNVLSGGIVQQIYGPFLAGFQTSINVDNGRVIDTNWLFEYRRRAYGVQLRYSPQQNTGFIGFRISDFNWTGRTAPFDGPFDAGDAVVQ